MKVGFTGTQKGMTDYQKSVITKWLESHGVTELHHGDCLGADEQIHHIARGQNIMVVTHPPLNPAKRAFCRVPGDRELKPYLERNHDIVDETEYLIAATRTNMEEMRSGTWATVRYARRMHKPIWIVTPNGAFVEV